MATDVPLYWALPIHGQLANTNCFRVNPTLAGALQVWQLVEDSKNGKPLRGPASAVVTPRSPRHVSPHALPTVRPLKTSLATGLQIPRNIRALAAIVINSQPHGCNGKVRCSWPHLLFARHSCLQGILVQAHLPSSARIRFTCCRLMYEVLSLHAVVHWNPSVGCGSCHRRLI